MWKQASLLALIVALAACEGSSPNPVNGNQDPEPEPPVEPEDPGPTPDNPIPDQLSLNVNKAEYDPAAGTLTVEISSLDGPNISEVYTRNPNLDIEGYMAFSQQDDPLDRFFVAVVADAPDGTTEATAIADGGQFGTFFRGTTYKRKGAYSIPTSGLVSYAGTYSGITNLDDLTQGEVQPPDLGTDPAILPAQPRQVQGRVFLNASFSDNEVNGAITDRTFTDDGSALSDIDLAPTEIDDNGEFLGTMEYRPDAAAMGEYGGIFGGTDASSVAGTVSVTTLYDGAGEVIDRGAEVGNFALQQCGTAGADPICAGLGGLE